MEAIMWKIIFVCFLVLCCACGEYSYYQKMVAITDPTPTNIYKNGKLLKEIRMVKLGTKDTASMREDVNYSVEFSIIKKGDTLFIDQLFPFIIELHKKIAP
jgi:hypothetical protein